MTPPTLLPPGSTLGGYRIRRLLGRGAMGEVYLATDRTEHRVAALKALALAAPVGARDLADARDRFLREAEAASRLDHPAIVKIYRSGEERGIAFIAMEAIAGGTLERYATSSARQLPAPFVLELVADVAEGLAHAHDNGVVHRDIKPANVMLDLATRRPKITDFGVARIVDAARTRTGALLGTPAYMAPEQLAGAPPDARTDLYALGVLLYQLLTTQLPFQAASMGELLRAIAGGAPRPIASLLPQATPALGELLAQALAKSPRDRFAHGRQLAGRLRELATRWPAV